MKNLCHNLAAVLLLAAFTTQLTTARAQGTAFTYQGRLNETNGPANGSYDIAFTGYNVATGGTSGGTITNLAVAVTNGLFTTTLDIVSIPSGSPIWLELAVRTNGSGAFTTLAPRQSVTPTPYAMFANTASNLVGVLPASKLPAGIVTNGANGVYLFGNFIGDGGSLTNVNAAQLGGLNRTNFWQLGGNIVRSNVDFIGTLNDAPLDFYVNSFRAFRLDSRANVLGGSRYNQVQSGGIYGDTISATVAGGGAYNIPNVVSAPFATVSGGAANTASGFGAVVSGGGVNGSNVGANTAGGPASVVAGGYNNQAYAGYSAVGGGANNSVSGLYSVIPGGNNNQVLSDSSFAAGNRAKANHYGSFVWADGQDADFASGGVNQFIIRAAGGVGINTNQPHAALQVNGTVMATNFVGAFNGNGSGLTALNASQVTSGTLPVSQLPAVVVTNGAAGVNLNGAFTGNGAGVTNVNAVTVNGLNSTNFWQLSGNNVAPGQFIGSTNNVPVEFNVNGLRALRLESNGSNAPNVIGGWSGNSVAAGVVGATVAGGGAGNYSFGLAYSNRIEANFGSVGGGDANLIKSNASESTISGGGGNTIHYGAFQSTISGGGGNTIWSNALASNIGGGAGNEIKPNSLYSTIGGGYGNSIAASNTISTISGGSGGHIWANSYYSSIGGGSGNQIFSSAPRSTIGGGYSNTIDQNSADSVVSGGFVNSIQVNSSGSVIGGGNGNTIQTNAPNATIAGGTNNTILASSTASTIGGGNDNLISRSALNSIIAGGGYNTIRGQNDSIGGGEANIAGSYITNDDLSISQSSYDTVAGGGGNYAGDDTVYVDPFFNYYSTIGFATVGGGQNNRASSSWSTVSGGYQNAAAGKASTVGGGYQNSATNEYATIPGGFDNVAGGTNSFAAGAHARAIHTGSFVWADSQAGNFSSTAINQVFFRCAGGVLITSGGGAANQAVSWTPGSASWSFSSDRNLKDRFANVNQQSVLDKLAQLPIVEWSYKGYAQRHIGPMAQDFHALFPLNENDKALQDADLHGVALAAIQGLNEKVESGNRKAESQMEELKTENAELRARLEKLEQLLLEKK